jgi:hypothetical protein
VSIQKCGFDSGLSDFATQAQSTTSRIAKSENVAPKLPFMDEYLGKFYFEESRWTCTGLNLDFDPKIQT